MQVDFFLENNARMDILQPGNMPAGTDRCGALPSRDQKADSEDTASFDAALESACARHETAGPPSSESRRIDPAATPAGHPHKKTPASSDPENSPENGFAEQTSPAKAQASATTALAPSAEAAIDATGTDAAVKTEATRLARNRHQSRVEKDAGGSNAKSAVPSPSSSGHGDSSGTGRVGGFSSVCNGSPSGDGLVQKFGHGPGRDVDAYRSEPQTSEKGAERPLWSTSALNAVDGGFQESTAATSAKSGTETEQKVADMLMAPQRAVNGAGEAAAAAEAGETQHTKELRAEIQNQIVDKAVVRLRNGQSEARIDLKPDSLGHVKLQIVTENHQVTLRILAESHAAKHVIESGIGQLKADLQAQGLRIDELEVSVANGFNDFNRHSAFSDDAAQARRLPSTGRRTFQETVPPASLKPAMENRATAGVDCFV